MCSVASADQPIERDLPAGRSCADKATRERAAQAFKDGIVAFEKKDWLKAQYHMLMAFDSNCGNELTVIVPYGRWRYRFKPEIYLGLAIHRLGQCLKVEGRACAGDREHWKGRWDDYLQQRLDRSPGWQRTRVVDIGTQERCEQTRAKPGQPACNLYGDCCFNLRPSGPRYCPVIDWRYKLGDSRVDEALGQTTSEKCGEVTTPLDWLWLGRVPKDSNAKICEQLGQELCYVENACLGQKNPC